jgi:hypothetical protein
MPLIFDPTKAFTTRAHPFSLHWNSVDLIDLNNKGFGVPLQSITINELGANAPSSISFTIADPKKALALPAIAQIQLNDHAANEVLFTGYLQRRRVVHFGGKVGYAVEAMAIDYSSLLDITIMPALQTAAGVSDQTLIQSVVAHSIRHKTIHCHHNLVTSTNSNMPAMDFTHLTLRAAIEAIQYNAGADRHYYVDFLGRLHYYLGPTEAGMGAAPYVISDAPTGAQRAAEGLVLEYDDSQIANAVYIVGATLAGSGWVKDEVSIKAYGLRQAIFEAVHSKTAGSLANAGNHFLARHKDPLVRGSFTTTGSDAGWRVGQTVTITNTAFGISSATYPIKQIDTTFLSGTGIRQRVIHFGELPASGRRKAKGGSGGVAAAEPVTRGAPHHQAPSPQARYTGHAGIPHDRAVH